MNFLKSRKFRQGTVATITTVLVVALIVILNMVFTALTKKFPLNLDMTTNKVFAISQETIDFLSKLDKDVTIYVLNSEDGFANSVQGGYTVQANEVIKKYAQRSGHINIVYEDILRNPGFKSLYPDLALESNMILVVSGTQTTTLSYMDLFNIESSYDEYYMPRSYITSSKAEQAMTSALLNVTSDKKILVTVLSGHGEVDITPFTDLLKMNNYEIAEQNLLTGDIDPETTIAIMAAPSRDMTEDELRRLDAFLENGLKYGKSLFYLASSEQPALPGIEAFLADWGIQVGDGVVFETSQNRILNMDPYITLLNYVDNEIVSNFTKNPKERGLLPAAVYSRPLSFAFESRSARSTFSVLNFSSSVGIRPSDAPSGWSPSQNDLSGPFPALALSRSLRYDNLTPLISNVLVAGSVDFIASGVLGSPNIANSELMLDTLNSLANREDVIRIQDKTIGSSQLGIRGDQVYGLTAFFAIIFPLSVLICGIVIWLRRRHR